MTDKDRIEQLSNTLEAVASARDKAEKACEDAAKELVNAYFKWNSKKSKMWWQTPNPLLGQITPEDMLKIGRSPKVLKFVVELICDNFPSE